MIFCVRSSLFSGVKTELYTSHKIYYFVDDRDDFSLLSSTNWMGMFSKILHNIATGNIYKIIHIDGLPPEFWSIPRFLLDIL